MIGSHLKHILQDESGFSLMETLVAVSILSVVSLSGMMIMAGFVQGNDALAFASNRMNALQSAQTEIRRDMAQLVKRPFDDGDNAGLVFRLGKLQTGLSALNDDTLLLKFARDGSELGAVDPARSTIELVEYHLKGDELVRRVYDRPDPSPDTPFREYSLLSGVTNLEIQGQSAGQWVDNWIARPGGANISPINSTYRRQVPRLIEFSFDLPRMEQTHAEGYTLRFAVGGV